MKTEIVWGQNESSKQTAKLKHVNACLLDASQYRKRAGFEAIELEHQAASAISLEAVNLSTEFLGKRLKAPLMIAPMTGGMELGALLNRRWALAAEHFGLPFGVGSQRLALENEQVTESFRVRKYAPTAMIFANLGATQLAQPGGIQLAVRAVAMIEADALFIHLNPLQEACQQHGDVNFSRILEAIGTTVELLKKQGIPVLAREVGFGLSEQAAKNLINTGIAGLDCAGAGGTSWAKVEALCATDETFRRLGETFGEWGIPTVESIKNVRRVHKTIPLIATGGVRSGLDVAKSLALGADVAAMAMPMLKAAIAGESALFSFVEQTLLELRVALFATGCKSVTDIPRL